VASDTPSSKIPDEALDAFLSGLLSELEQPSDTATLVQVRAIFRKRIPFRLRSYAAALMILRAAGISRTILSKSEAKAPKGIKPVKPAASSNDSQSPDVRKDSAARIDQGASIPLFVSMGKRQRLRPHELRLMISEKTGISVDSLGRVHLFDNYSFIDVPESEAARICEAMVGSSVHGRPVEIKPAKKRNETAEEGK
jgi:ATP-dependent RNA helicase DeaD